MAALRDHHSPRQAGMRARGTPRAARTMATRSRGRCGTRRHSTDTGSRDQLSDAQVVLSALHCGRQIGPLSVVMTTMVSGSSVLHKASSSGTFTATAGQLFTRASRQAAVFTNSNSGRPVMVRTSLLR